MPERSNYDTNDLTIEDLSRNGPDELGDAIEEYLERTERNGRAPEISAFVAEFPQCREELTAALEGLAVVHGLLGSGGGSRAEASGSQGKIPAVSLKPGNSLAGYRIVRELGRGGMGVVYEAVHVDLDRPVALKVLREWSGGSARRRFLNEAKTAASLHHTNIVPVFDVGQTENATYYAMQKIDGDGLDRIIRRRRSHESSSSRGRTSDETEKFHSESPDATAVIRTEITGRKNETTPSSGHSRDTGRHRPTAAKNQHDSVTGSVSGHGGSASFARWVARAGYQAAMALEYAHNKQVVHRDVKPSNLILDQSGTIWVTDFGLALRLDDPGLSRGDGVLGTPRYTSPEQAARKVVDYRTDIYSLGVTLYELLTGVPAYDGDSSDEVIRKILTESPATPRSIDPSISRDLETIILKAMANRPEDRYATAGELAEDLDRFLRYEPVKARRIGPIGRFSRLLRRHPAVSTVTAVAASIVIGVAIFAYRQVARERDDALIARSETLTALNGEKIALEKAKGAMRSQLWREASLVRMSSVPNRRRRILELVAEAATYEPEPELQSKLRNEVVEALSMNDARAAAPVTYDPIADFEIMADQRRAITISEDHRSMTVWDIESRTKKSEVLIESLFTDNGTDRQRPKPDPSVEEPGIPGPSGNSLGRGQKDGYFGGMFRRFFRTIFAVGNTVGIVRPDGNGIIWIDPDTAEPRGDWNSPNGAVILYVQAIANQPRILTIEYHPLGYGIDATGRFLPPNASDDEIVIQIHDLKATDSKPLLLDKMKFEPEKGRALAPVLSQSTDGDWVALGRTFEDSIRILDTRTGKELGNISAQVPVTSIAAGPQRMLSVAGGGTIRLWRYELRHEDGTTRLSTSALPSLGTNLGAVGKIRFSPTDNLIAASGASSGIELWDIDSGQAVATLGTGGPVNHIAFAANGNRMLASTADTKNGSLRVWNVEKPQIRNFVGTAPDTVVVMASLGLGESETLLIQGSSGQIRYRSQNDHIFRKVEFPTETSRVTAFRTDESDRLWVMMDGSVQRFDAWSPNRSPLPSPSKKYTISEKENGDWPNRSFWTSRIPGGIVADSHSKRVFAFRGQSLMMLDPSVSEQFIPISLGQPDRMFPPNTAAPGSNGSREPFNKNQVSDPPPNQGRDNDSRQGRARAPQTPRPSEPMAGFWTFRGQTPFSRKYSILPGGEGFIILRGSRWEYWEIDKLIDTSAGKMWSVTLRSPPSGTPSGEIVAQAVSPDGRILALGEQTGKVTLLDLMTWRSVAVIHPETDEEEPRNDIVDLKFSPDDPSYLAIVRERAISFWCLHQQPKHFLDLPVDLKTSSVVAWNHTGSGLYVVDNENNIYFWDVRRLLETITEMKLR
jgi:serine/threonine protein kinase/WD40 repeat protein